MIDPIELWFEGKREDATTVFREQYTRRELEMLIYQIEDLKSAVSTVYADKVVRLGNAQSIALRNERLDRAAEAEQDEVRTAEQGSSPSGQGTEARGSGRAQ